MQILRISNYLSIGYSEATIEVNSERREQKRAKVFSVF